MSDWTRLAQDAADAVYDTGARLRVEHVKLGHCIVWLEDWQRQVLAIAGGPDHGAACRALVQMCYRDDHRPTTAEVAAVLGVQDSRVRQLVQAGTLTPEQPGNSGQSARFGAQAVYELVIGNQTILPHQSR